MNGEQYEGGQFLPSSPNTVKGAIKVTIRKGTKSEVAPYVWEAAPADDMLSIYDRIGYLCSDNRNSLTFVKGEGFNGLRITVSKQLIAMTNEGPITWDAWDAYCEARYQWAQKLADKFNAGERWFALADDPYHYKNAK